MHVAHAHATAGGPDPLAVMLEARSVALVGASPRPGSLGARMIAEVAKSPAAPRTYLVNPRYEKIGTERVYPASRTCPSRRNWRCSPCRMPRSRSRWAPRQKPAYVPQ